MQILVARKDSSDKATLGKMTIDGVDECLTLEDVVREVPGEAPPMWKIQNETAIPVGTYAVIIDESPHFGQEMPHIMNVPGFEDIRIHWGNTDKDTDGCILLGTSIGGPDFISNSRAAFNAFFPKLQAAIAAGEAVTITITNP